ncbi:hypothetical protein VTK56DRAFT_6769 [Thermocarpiscus australiensis]
MLITRLHLHDSLHIKLAVRSKKVPPLVRVHPLPRLIHKVTVIMRLPKRPQLRRPTRPARLPAQVRPKSRRHVTPHMPGIRRPRIGTRTVMREDNHLPPRPLQRRDPLVQPPHLLHMPPVMRLHRPATDIPKVIQPRAHGRPFGLGHMREECAPEDGHLLSIAIAVSSPSMSYPSRIQHDKPA